MAEAANHGKKKRRKPDPEIDPEFQIAPMIDILLVLLVFFMSISSTEVLQSNQNVRLPIAKEAKDAKKSPGQVIVNVLYSAINNATTVEIDDKAYVLPELTTKLNGNVLKNPQVRVLIRADREVKYEYMRSLLEAIGKAGIATITFSVVDKETEKNY